MTRRPPPPRDPSSHPEVDPHLEVREKRQGKRIGDAYVRIVRPFEDTFERGGEGNLVASERTVLHRKGWTSMLRRIRTTLIGRPISSDREGHERLSKKKALAIFSSDNISSSAYGPEEMMRVLATAGVAAVAWTLPLAILIILMLAIVVTSYRQTIKAYPMGASSYLVASDNLGPVAGVTAAAALMIGYVVTVAVSISAGAAALTSIYPALFEHRVLIAVAAVVILTVGNLRGIRESGTLFMAPTYLYVVAILGLIGWGVAEQLMGTLATYVAPPIAEVHEVGPLQALSLLLLLRAFSSGAVALTGVEAISDGVPAFERPEWRNARTTLTLAAAIFAILFIGIAYLVVVTGIIPDASEQETVLSQLTRLITGDGPYLYLVQISTALLLVLAANTSFADFPRLSSFLARDGYLPRQFAFRGERLAFTTGIVALALMAVLLIIGFDARVSALIPLYTLGVFIAFTLSQGGMLVRWWRRREEGWRRGMAITGLGTLTTFGVMVVVSVSNFTRGAWLVAVLVPLLMWLLVRIHGHYQHLEATLDLTSIPEGKEVAPAPIVIVPIARLDRPALQAIAFANSISRHAVAVHITNEPSTADELRERWPEWAGTTELVVVESPYRALIGPLLAYMDALQQQAPERAIVVVLNEVVPNHWWENLLHNQTALRLKLRLFSRRNTIVADVPYHLR
jgi:amino acid transporter